MECTSIVVVLKTDVKLHHYCAAIDCKGANSDMKILHRVAQEAKLQQARLVYPNKLPTSVQPIVTRVTALLLHLAAYTVHRNSTVI